MVHKMNVNDRSVKLEIWDTAGQERYVKKIIYIYIIFNFNFYFILFRFILFILFLLI